MSIDFLETPVGWLAIRADAIGITHVTFADTRSSARPNQITALAVEQLNEYLSGVRRQFSLPLNAQGTDFQRSVWDALTTVDYATTASYLDIATRMGKPTACRAVGAANGKNPISIIVPCHRVIGKNGTLTGYAGGLERKRWLLSLEHGDSLF